MTIKEFLSKNPSVAQILEFIESESQRIVKERKVQQGRAQAN